jgi:hypothetical protein
MNTNFERLIAVSNKLAHQVELTPADQEFLRGFLEIWGATFPPGSNVSQQQMALTLRYVFEYIQAQGHETIQAQADFERVKLLSYILPPTLRRNVFEPSFNDIKSDFVKARRRYSSNGQRRWLMFCFGLHTSILVSQCVWATLSDKTKRIIFKLVPEVLRRWWGGVS